MASFQWPASGGGGSSYTFADSLANSSGTVTLVNDSATPGDSKYYGTNGSGTLGYFALPTSAVWGSITGTLSNQTDLQNALNLLAPIASPTFTGTATGTFSGSLTGHASLDVASSTLGTLTETTSSVLTLSSWTDATVGSPTITVKQSSGSQSGYLSSTDWTTFNNKGSGTVTSISVASSNGFAGSSSGGATPSLTLSTSITGILKGNGTAILAATSGTDYVIPSVTTLSSLSLPASQLTGLSTAIAGDTVTNISASSNATLTTLSSLSLPLSQTTGVLPIANGGTDNGSLPVTAGGVLYTDGTKFQNVGAGSSGQFLQSTGATAPIWASGTSLNYAWYNGTPTGSFGSGNIAYPTFQNDSAVGYNVSTGVYTIPATGIYNIAASVAVSVTSGSVTNITITQNSTSIAFGEQISPVNLTNSFVVGAAINSVNCTLGDTITVQAGANGSPTFLVGSFYNFFSITQQNTNIISSVSAALIGGMVTYGIYD